MYVFIYLFIYYLINFIYLFILFYFILFYFIYFKACTKGYVVISCLTPPLSTDTAALTPYDRYCDFNFFIPNLEPQAFSSQIKITSYDPLWLF